MFLELFKLFVLDLLCWIFKIKQRKMEFLAPAELSQFTTDGVEREATYPPDLTLV